MTLLKRILTLLFGEKDDYTLIELESSGLKPYYKRGGKYDNKP